MPIKGSGEANLMEIDRFEHGVGWLAYPEEGMQRASHALAVPPTDDEPGAEPEVWVVDPVDASGVDDLLDSLGSVAGVVVGLDRHKRNCAALARRHDVPVFVPEWMDGVESELDATTARFSGELADTGFRAIEIRNSTLPPWQELGLYDGETLVVPEALGTAEFFRVGDERLGVHPMLRLVPPRNALGGLDPDRILVGHGRGIHEDAARALSNALGGSRRRAPAAFTKALGAFLGR
jgi:hypothetical protein